MQLSIVTTLYKSRPFLERFLKECIDAVKELEIKTFEFVFVLDGITDDAKEFLLETKHTSVPQIRIVELSRNFGHHYAILAGLRCTKGQLVFLIDCDMEVSPSVLIAFKQQMDNLNADVVYGIQQVRKGGFLEREMGKLFWKFFNLLSQVKIPKDVVTERLMKRPYVDALISLGDRNIFMGGMMYWVGYNQSGVYIRKKKRIGKTTYSIFKRINLLVEAITSFSERPVKLIFNFGLIVFLISFGVSFGLIIRKIIFPESILVGFTSIIVILLMILGLILVSVGIVGIYLARVFRQVQDRPQYIIKNLFD